jgi:hypothetical protein
MFNSNMSGYSLSDIAAVSGRNNDGFGDGNGWWIILLFLFAFGGGWGNNWGNGGNGSIREEVAYGFDMNGLENGVRGVQQGLCDGFYAMNTGMLNGFSNVQSALCQGFSGVNNSINQNTNALNANISALSTQMAQCCCDNRYDMAKGFADLGYALATQSCDTRRTIADSTRDIIENNNAGVRSILDFLTQDKIATLQAENQSLRFAASQQAQNAYLVSQLKEPCAVPAYVVPNPNCAYPAAAYTGCGC